MSKKSLYLKTVSANDVIDLPPGILVDVDRGLYDDVLRLSELCKRENLREASVYWNFSVPEDYKDEHCEKLDQNNFALVDSSDYADVEDTNTSEGECLVVRDGMVWFQYYDKHSEERVETDALDTDRFLDLIKPHLPAPKQKGPRP